MLVVVGLDAVEEIVVDELHGTGALRVRVLVEHGVDDVRFHHLDDRRRRVERHDAQVIFRMQRAHSAAGAIGTTRRREKERVDLGMLRQHRLRRLVALDVIVAILPDGRDARAGDFLDGMDETFEPQAVAEDLAAAERDAECLRRACENGHELAGRLAARAVVRSDIGMALRLRGVVVQRHDEDAAADAAVDFFDDVRVVDRIDDERLHFVCELVERGCLHSDIVAAREPPDDFQAEQRIFLFGLPERGDDVVEERDADGRHDDGDREILAPSDERLASGIRLVVEPLGRAADELGLLGIHFAAVVQHAVDRPARHPAELGQLLDRDHETAPFEWDCFLFRGRRGKILPCRGFHFTVE